MRKFHLISWCGNFVEKQSFAIRLKLCGNFAFPQNFYTIKLGKIQVFYAVSNRFSLTNNCAQVLIILFFFISENSQKFTDLAKFTAEKMKFSIKGYLRYKTINSQNVSSEAHVKSFFYFIEKSCFILKVFKLLYFQPFPNLPNM